MSKKAYQLDQTAVLDPTRLLTVHTPDGSGPSQKITLADFMSGLVKATATVGIENADFKVTDTDNLHTQLQAAMDYCADERGGGVVHVKGAGSVHYKAAAMTWRNGVSLYFDKDCYIVGKDNVAPTLFKSEDFDTAAGSGDAWAGIQHVFFWGGQFEGGVQALSGASDYRGENAILKVYGWDLLIGGFRFNYCSEIGLYTEHDSDWNSDGPFNTYEFGENTYLDIKIKNYGQVGWVNRGSHDSVSDKIYISSADASGLNPDYGYVQQTDDSTGKKYGAHGHVAHYLHVWGQHNWNAVLLDNSNIIDGFVYAEGSDNAAIFIRNSSANKFNAFVGYCTNGVELQGTANGNEITAIVESNVSGALFKMNDAAGGNILRQGPGYGSPGGAVFDVSSVDYAGGRNIFVPWYGYTGSILNGTLLAGDFIQFPASDIDVRAFGAKGDARRIFAAVASSASAVVTSTNGQFTSADVGKKAIVYKSDGAGVITTVLSRQSSTQITLAANAGITTTSGNGYLVIGTDDSAAIQKALTFASSLVYRNNSNEPNQPIGSGHIRVKLTGHYPTSGFVLTSAITVYGGILFDGQSTLYNLLTSRNATPVNIDPFAKIERLEVESAFGGGIFAGPSVTSDQAHIGIEDLKIWHVAGSSSAISDLGVTGSTSGGTLTAATRYYVVTAIDSQGGETPVSNEVSVVNTGSTSSNALDWSDFSGASSYRIYQGTSSGKYTKYFTSATSSYTDTGASGTFYAPVGPGVGLKLHGYHYDLGRIFIKEATLGIFHASGSDTAVDSAFIVGCDTAVRMNSSNQIRYNNLFLDTCGSNSGSPGVMIDNQCGNISLPNIQVFQVTGTSADTTPVVQIGSYHTNVNKDIYIGIKANNTGGTLLSLNNVTDLKAVITGSNTQLPSGISNSITTAIVYGSTLAGEIDIEAVLSTGITPYSGTLYGNLKVEQGGIPRFYSYITVPNFKTGQAKITGGGTQQWGIPGTFMNSSGTSTLTINSVRYTPIFIPHPITITAFQFEVTAGPASDANVRVGLYAADSEMQPTSAAPLINTGVAVATGFTGIKTTSSLSVTVPAGAYLVAVNCDVAMTIRTLISPSPIAYASMGASPLVQRFDNAQTYASFPTPGTKWGTVNTSSGGLQHGIEFQWTENA